ncbi:MAG TPA: folylpolyglutamate synthase/dihydrofolate synthase family protein [Vicinamibacterales bacterium]|nr:folylpolyglutamate synthase/dihydrofolate synthase family protein [Vicinamibacterales bacterium]
MDPFDYLLSLEKFGIKFGLANIRTLATALGDPQNTFRSVLIAGTNGKGSVTAMVDRALRAAGLSVGRYTSPHLICLEERFTINGEPVATAELASVIEKMRTLVDALMAQGALEAPPTFFEMTTAIAFELFRRTRVDFGVLEVGLGGRLDATNVVDPVAAAITSIDFDHEQYLGNTLAAIAGEKAGIIRHAIPIVVGPLPTEARDVIVSACGATGAELIEADRGVRVESTSDRGRTSVRITTAARDYEWVPLGLRGEHQVPNALVAVRLLEHLAQMAPIPADAIVAGLRDVRWPGRLQMLETSDGRRVLLDAAHNPAGAWALATYLRREFPEPLPIVFAAMRDKDVALMLRALLPVASKMVMTHLPIARALPAEELATIAAKLSPRSQIDIRAQPREALERAWAHCPVACAAGSIFLVGALLDELGPSVRDL